MMNNTPRTSCQPLFLEGIFSFLLIFVMISSAIAAVAPDVQSYDGLVSAIRQVRSLSEKRMEQERVRVAWETGKLIDEHVLQHKDRADYGAKVLERLASDLDSSTTELSFMLKFYRTNPILSSTKELSWSHYREILSLNDAKARKEITDEAIRQHWSEKELRTEVRRRQAGSNVKKETYPSVTPGQVYTYRVVKAAHGPYQGQLGVDLGFSNYFQPEGINQFNEGDVVIARSEATKQSQDHAQKPEIASSASGLLAMTKANEDELHTYYAYVTEVIDGDTFHAVVDLGFKFVTEQKLRLRGLDAPEIESADGREAKEFLLTHGVRPGARILVKTVKSDKYDRYLADVWVDDQYINQQLFDEGLAVRVNE